MANTIQVKRGNYASLPTLADGEFGLSEDQDRLHIGDASTNHEVMLHANFAATSFMYATSDNTPQNKTPAEVMAILSGTASAAFAMNTQKITGVVDPTAAQDVATKAYVDSVAAGLNVHTAVACATTGNISLTGEQTLDGILTSADRVLVKEQTDATENGIYVSAAGAWSRAADMDAAAEVAGSFVFIEDGTTLGSTGWVCTNEPETVAVGTSDITFAQFSDAGFVTASDGLAKTGNNIAPDGLLEDLNTLGACSADSEVMVGTAAGVMAWESGATLRTSLGLAIGTNVLAEQTIGIANDNLVEMDDADAAASDYAKFTVNGLEGRSYSEVMGDLSGTAGASFSMNTQLITNVVDPVSDQDAATKKWTTDNFTAGASLVGLDDTPANYTGAGLKILRVNGTPDAVEFVNFEDTYLEGAPTEDLATKAPTSEWAFDHDAATTGVHGAGANTILHSASTIDGGAFT
jgi:hypothetical protein